MFRKVSIVALVIAAAVGGLAISGCGRQAEQAKPDVLPNELAVDLGDGIKPEMVLIPAGDFMMGSPDSVQDASGYERPQHRVRITKPFYLGKYPVTQEQWEAAMGSNPSWFKGPKNPVEQVSWEDCQRFLADLNARIGAKGGKFVLPTEAQWEYACRAGSTTRFCFGDDYVALDDYAWCNDNSGGKTHPVGRKKANAWGLYDMHGNVFEWCQDWFDGGYYAKSPTDDPTGPATGSDRVSRGGCYDAHISADRSAGRFDCMPGMRDWSRGFRVALIPAGKFTTVEPKADTARHITNSNGMNLTVVPSGEFQMGTKESAKETATVVNNNNQAEGKHDKADGGAIIDLLLPKSISAPVHNNQGEALRNKGEYDKAIAEYNDALKLDPNSAAAYNNRGLSWNAKGQYEKAIADFNQAIKLNPTIAVAYNNRGLSTYQKGEYDKAIADFNQALKLDPKLAVAYFNRGESWGDQGEYDKAIADFNQAIRLEPNDADAYNNRGVAWDTKREYDKAIADYSQALMLDPTDPKIYGNRGKSWNAKGEYDKAIADYNQALKLDPKLAIVYSMPRRRLERKRRVQKGHC